MRTSLNRVVGRPQFYQRPMPKWAVSQLQVEGEREIAYTTAIPLGVVPPIVEGSIYRASMVSMAYRTAESGADASNYTALSLRVGTPASYTEIASLDTQAGPGALEITAADASAYLNPGDLIFAYWTRTGSGSVDYAGEMCLVVLDIVGERRP